MFGVRSTSANGSSIGEGSRSESYKCMGHDSPHNRNLSGANKSLMGHTTTQTDKGLSVLVNEI